MKTQKPFTDADLVSLVENWETRTKIGFLPHELEAVYNHVNSIKKVNEQYFNDALMGVTCGLFGGELCIYHEDVIAALRSGLRRKNLNSFEWD